MRALRLADGLRGGSRRLARFMRANEQGAATEVQWPVAIWKEPGGGTHGSAHNKRGGGEPLN